MPVPCELIFTGEYSYDGEHWYPYNENSVLSALEGEVTVKGHFDTDISEGAILNFYCNHIGVSIDVNGEPMYVDAPAEIMSYGAGLTPSMCGKRWEQILCPAISAEDELEFRLCNYHKHGNESAYKEVLSTCFITPLDKLVLEAYLTPYIKPFEMIGTAFLIVSLMLFGATLSTTVLKSGIAKQLFKMGVITLFVGGYIMFDVMMVFFTDELLVMKTYGAQVCRMLAVYFLGSLFCNTLTETNKKAAEIAMLVSGITNALILLFVISGTGLLYDTKYVWESVQCGISLLFLVLCLAEIKKQRKSEKT